MFACQKYFSNSVILTVLSMLTSWWMGGYIHMHGIFCSMTFSLLDKQIRRIFTDHLPTTFSQFLCISIASYALKTEGQVLYHRNSIEDLVCITAP